MIYLRKKINLTGRILCLMVCYSMIAFFPGNPSPVYGEAYNMERYTKNPIFVQREIKPNVVFALDISGSMKAVAYRDVTAGTWSDSGTYHDDFDPADSYYGYFESNTLYTYNTTKEFFEESAIGEWDGDFLNWVTMRRIDVARKVMVGGKVTMNISGTDYNRNRVPVTPVLGTNWDGYYILDGQQEPEDRTFNKRYSLSQTGGFATLYPNNTTFKIYEGKLKPSVGAAPGAAVVALSTEVEIGQVTMNWDDTAQDWVWVPFENTYRQPRVVIKTATLNGAQAMGIPRIKWKSGESPYTDNSTTGFYVRFQEWEYLDGNHTTENIAYIVVESENSSGGDRGWVDLKDDQGFTWKFQADHDEMKVGGPGTGGDDNCGRFGQAGFESKVVTYDEVALQKPIVFSGLASFGGLLQGAADGSDDTDALVTRHLFDGASDFFQVQVAIQEQENKNSKVVCDHDPDEYLHVILVIPPNGATTTQSTATFNAGEVIIKAGVRDEVTDSLTTITYNTTYPFTQTPAFLGDMQTTKGGDPSNVRVDGTNGVNDKDQIKLKILEDQSLDDETTHSPGPAPNGESVGWLAIQAGASTAVPSEYRIRVGVQEEPTGIIQDISDSMRIGLVVYNYDHINKIPTDIYTGLTVHGGTLNPCFPDASLASGDRTNYDICLSCGVHDPVENIIQAIELHPLIWGSTPIAETLYEVMRYAKQTGGGTGYYNNFQNHPTDDDFDKTYPAGGAEADGTSQDPYYYLDDEDDPSQGGEDLSCAKTFVLHFNDGAPFRDWDPAVSGQDPAGFTQPAEIVSDGVGAFGQNEALDDLALYIRKNDLRTDLSGHQEIITYYVYAALGEAEDSNATNRVRQAAANGGFEDSDNNNEPDVAAPSSFTPGDPGDCTPNEWDEDGDCSPDTFYFASDGYQLVDELMAAFQSILQRTSSGTAASVISNSRSGEGAIYQSVFYPSFGDGTGKTVEWVGQVHAMMVDAYGNIREDSNNNSQLDLDSDKIIIFDQSGDTISKYIDTNADGEFTDTEKSGQTPESGDIKDIEFLWLSNEWLNDFPDTDAATQRTYNSTDQKRYIFTFADDGDMVGESGEQVAFDVSNLATAADLTDSSLFYRYIQPYQPIISTPPVTAPSYIEDQRSTCAGGGDCTGFNDFLVNQTQRIINYIRGQDQAEFTSTTAPIYTIPAFRSRQVDYTGGTGTATTWRLGDVINSTPTLVGRPAESYDLLYGDTSYAEFYNAYRNRRNVVYFGANDGMFHALNGGFYNDTSKKFATQLSGETAFSLGAEIWAYVPYNLLPHLHWLTSTEYTHIYFADMKPKVFDAKIFDDDATHPNGWGTVLVGGMRFGGGKIAADIDKTDGTTFDSNEDLYMSSAYFILDITDPESPPELLGEITLPDMGFTTCYPAVIPMKNKQVDGGGNVTFDEPGEWYLVFGSGPTGATDPDQDSMLNGTSAKTAKVFVLDLVKLVQDDTLCMVGSGGTCVVDVYSDPPDPAYYVDTFDSNSFVSDPVSVDWNLDFNTDSLYFGTIEGSEAAGWGGKMRRIFTDNSTNPANWYGDSTLIDLSYATLSGSVGNGQPIMAPPTIGLDTDGNHWVFFGTGRFYATTDAANDDQQSYYGIKDEVSTADPSATVTRSGLLDVTLVKVYEGGNTVENIPGGGDSYDDLLDTAATKDGWFLDFPDAKERNLGQATLFGDIVTFTTYIPSQDPCEFEGETYLYAVDFRTGTAFEEPVIGTDPSDTVTETVEGETVTKEKVLRRTSLGVGLSTTPNIHTGREAGSKAFVQTSTGSIQVIEQSNPGGTKSGTLSWEEED